jgi:hypothetical protein
MKKKWFGIIGAVAIAGGLLAGCGTDSASNDTEEKATASDQKEVSNKEPEKKEEKAKDSGNAKVGDKIKTESGTAELLKKQKINETIDISPVKMTIKGMLLAKMSDVPEEEKEYLEYYTETELGDEFTYLQVDFTAENTEEKNIGFNGIEKIVLNNGEQLDVANKNFMVGDFDTTFYGKVKQDGSIGVVVKGSPDEIKSAKIITGSAYDDDTFEDITGQQQVEYKFE